MQRLSKFLCLWALSSSLAAHAGTVQVAVAANFSAPMERIAIAFQAADGHTLKLSSGATGKFRAQIVAGAPFEVLLAADERTPQALIDAGHAVAGSRFTYATGRLALWSVAPGLVDARGDVLKAGSFKHLAIANPKTAPYGAAAMQVLRSLSLERSLTPRLVTGESIAQAYQFVATGNAELGFVALSQVIEPGRAHPGSMWLVPQALHEPIRQDAALLKAGQDNPAAVALLAFLKTATAREIIRAYGYVP